MACCHDPRGAVAKKVKHPHDPRLCIIVKIRDLIEDKAAALGPRHQGGRPLDPGKIGGLSNHEGLAPPIREIVNGPRNQRFSGAGFAGDQHRQIGVHDARDQSVQRLHNRRAPHQRQIIPRIARAADGAWLHPAL